MREDYINIYYSYYPSLQGKLLPIRCNACAEHYSRWGECDECLRNQAANREYLQTHTFITDATLRSYHNDDHDTIKRMPLRLPNEHPRLFYGIELEIEFDNTIVGIDGYDDDDEGGGESIGTILEKFTEITDGLFVYERDGSLDNGVELISRPCSYAFWTDKKTVAMLKKGLEYLVAEGALIRQPITNGYHIHLSEKFFRTDKNGEMSSCCRDDAYKKFDWLFQKFQPELELLGGREYTSYCASKAMDLKGRLSRISRDFGNDNCELEIKGKLKRGGCPGSGDHHVAVNQSGETIEVRTFKSTTDYKEVLARIELVRNFAHAVRDGDIHETLDSLLHTKDNLYLDEHIGKVKIAAKKEGKKLNLDKFCDDEIEINHKQ